MGISSSQPVTASSQSTIAPTSASLVTERSLRCSEYSVDHMTDERSLTSSNGVAASNSPARSKHQVEDACASRKPPSPQAASQVVLPQQSQATLRSYGLHDLQAYTEGDEIIEASSGWQISLPKEPTVDGPTLSPEVEVPDSQIAPIAYQLTPLSPPVTSSVAIPASLPDKHSPVKQCQRTKQSEVEPNDVLPEQDIGLGEGTTMDASEVGLPGPLGRKRKRQRSSYLKLELSDQADSARAPSDQNSVAALPHTAVVDGVFGSAKRKKRRRKQEQTCRVWEVIENAHVDPTDEIIHGRSQRLEKKLRRLKKLKPRQSMRKATHTDDGAKDRSPKITNGDEEAMRPEVGPQDDIDLGVENAVHEHAQDEAGGIEESALPGGTSSARKFGDKSPSFQDDEAAEQDDNDEHDDSVIPPESSSGEDEIPPVAPIDSRTSIKNPEENFERRSSRTRDSYASDQQDMARLSTSPLPWTAVSTVTPSAMTATLPPARIDHNTATPSSVSPMPGQQISHQVNAQEMFSNDEEELLARAVVALAQRIEDYPAESGKPLLAEYANNDINWLHVYSEMGNIRHHIQMSAKWTNMEARDSPPSRQLKIEFRNEKTEQVVEPTPKRGRGRPRKGHAQPASNNPRKRGRPRKSLKLEKEPSKEKDTPLPRKSSRTSNASTMSIGQALLHVGH